MGVRCPVCGRRFRTAQGKRGHLNFYHGLAKETPFTRAIRWDINRKLGGMKKKKEEKNEDKTKREERREKALGVLWEYEKSLAEREDNVFIVEKEKTTEDTKFIDKVEFE